MAERPGGDYYNSRMPYSFAEHLARFGPDARYPPPSLGQARNYCARLTREHYENFSVASVLLPRRLLPHFYPVYAYCRWADDLGDETGGGPKTLELLAWWRQEILNCYEGHARHPVMVALRPTIVRFAIPPKPFLDLLAAFEQDQRVQCYGTYDELLNYCVRSANPVGRLVLYLCASFDEVRARLSDHVCTGLQLANFWQDVKRDYLELGRVYLPEEDRIRFGYTDADLAAARFTPAFAALMTFEVERARDMLERGRPLVALLPADVRADIELFIEGGLTILRKIEQRGYDVLTHRPTVSKKEKVRLLLRALRHRVALPRRSSSRSTASDRGSPITNNVSPSYEQKSPIAASYLWCHELTIRTARNFYAAFLVLPRRQRKFMEALYAFMRVTDDLADEPEKQDVKRDALKKWRIALDRALEGESSHPLHAALTDTVKCNGIPAAYLHEVIDGVEMDLEPVRFARFEDLYAYCLRVASAVGLACIHIWGFRTEKAKEFAKAAGVAFQLTNILRDIGEDLNNGRVYLPEEDIERFHCPPSTWRDRGASFEQMMKFQIERARCYYTKAEQLTELLMPAGRAVFKVMMRIYRGLLKEIERRDYDVFSQRVRIPSWRKMRWLLMAFPVRWGWI